MSDAAILERSYRRLLAWYPVAHRTTYGEEMIGVLMASAPGGRRHPAIGDVTDLIRGGLAARIGSARSGLLHINWQPSPLDCGAGCRS
jgi:hypothetical protein